jgi:hypothetical protein
MVTGGIVSGWSLQAKTIHILRIIKMDNAKLNLLLLKWNLRLGRAMVEEETATEAISKISGLLMLTEAERDAYLQANPDKFAGILPPELPSRK